MKFIPRKKQIVGRMTIKKSDSTIILVQSDKVTKYLLVDAVGEDAAKAGIKVGDVLVAKRVNHIVQDAGRVFISFADEEDVLLFATDVTPDTDLLMQTPSGKEFVPFDSEEAAKPYGVAPEVREAKAA